MQYEVRKQSFTQILQYNEEVIIVNWPKEIFQLIDGCLFIVPFNMIVVDQSSSNKVPENGQFTIN